MASIITDSLRRSIAKTFYDSIFSRRNKFYYSFGKPAPGQNFPETPLSTVEYERLVRSNIIAAKRLYSSDVSFVTPRFDWVSGNTYNKYSTLDTGNIDPVNGPKFYVYEPTNYRVYKCLDNNNNAASTVRPTSVDPFPVTYSDGYTWLYMYTLTTGLRNKFLTSNYIPVTNALKSRYYSNGGISEVTIVKAGSGYNQSTTTIAVIGDGTGAVLQPVISGGQLGEIIIVNAGQDYTRARIEIIDSSMSGSGAELTAELNTGDLDSDQALVELLSTPGTVDTIEVLNGGTGYVSASVKIEGDGRNATAEAVVNPATNSIERIIVNNPGSNYTYARAVITAQSNPARTLEDVDAVTRINISPFLGHGRNAIDEFYCNTLMFYSSVFNDRLADFDVEAGYRQVGLIQDPRNFEFSPAIYDQVSPNRYQVEGDFGPVVTILGGGGRDSRARATVTGDKIVDIDLEDGGENYNTPPSVNFIGSGEVTITVTTTIGSNIVKVPDTSKLIINALIESNANFPAGARIISIDPVKKTIAVSANALATGNISTKFYTTAEATAIIRGKLTSASIVYGGAGFAGSTSLATVSPVSSVPANNATVTGVMSQGVGAVDITNGGSGYTTATVTIDPPSGGDYSVQATATATIVGGKIAKITVTNPGAGYTSIPIVTITGNGSSAAGTAVMTNTLSETNITSAGDFYQSAPIVSFNSNCGLKDIEILDCGSGFNIASPPTVSISGSATAKVTVANCIRVIAVVNAGSGYNPLDTSIAISGDGTGATAIPIIQNGVIIGVKITNRGSGYTNATASVTSSSGSGAVLFTTVAAGGISAINLTNPGAGYTFSNTITIALSGGNNGAIFNPVLARPIIETQIEGPVSSVVLNSTGANYTSAPTITFTGGGGTGAKAYPKVVGFISDITVIDGGTGYSSSPEVFITEGEGSGFVGRAFVDTVNKKVSSIQVVNGGSNYVTTKFSNFSIGNVLTDSELNEYTIVAAKANNLISSLIVSSNSGAPVTPGMKLRLNNSAESFICKTSLVQKIIESRFPTACWTVRGTFDLNNVTVGGIFTLTDQVNGNKTFRVISKKEVIGSSDNELLLQPLDGGTINNGVFLTDGVTSFSVSEYEFPDIDTRTGDVLMISNNTTDITQNQDQSITFRTVINF